MEQVKGSCEMKEKIISASKESRLQPGYPQELLPDYFSLCDKYLAHAHYNNTENHQSQVPAVHSLNHVHSNGKKCFRNTFV